MPHIIHVHRRPSDPTIYRSHGQRKALEALDPIWARFQRMRGDFFDSPARIIGLSTIHCFNCDGKGFYDDFYGFTIQVEDFHEFFAGAMRAIKIHIEWSPFSDSRMSLVP